MTIWTGSAGVKRLLCKLGVGLALTAVLPGCFAHTRGEIVYDHDVAYVEDVPPRIERYPSTHYHGRPAYLVDGRWYYRHQDRWVYFRDEPVELREYRVRRAPAAYTRGPQRYSDVAAERRGYAREREAERRHAEREYAQHRAEQRRIEDRRAAERRADARRAEARREAELRDRQRRAAEHRADERRAAERRQQRKERVAERPRTQDDKKRARNRYDRDDRDDRDERRRYRD
jgi:hypothetical protein